MSNESTDAPFDAVRTSDQASLSDLLDGVGYESRDVLRAAVRMSPLPMVLTDPCRPDSPLVFTNRAFTQLTGYQAKEVLGRNCRFLQGERTDPAAVQALRQAQTAGQQFQVGLWNYRKDGTAFWNLMFIGPVRNREGKLLFWFGSQLDATAQLEADEARARVQRMDTLGSMAAGIAHEFNNLMTVALGNIKGIAVDPLTPRQTERLERVDWAAQAAGRLTQQMLSFAGRQAQNTGLVDVNEVIGAFDRLLTQVAKSGSNVKVQLHPERLPARLDVGQLELALINLVKNASDACAPGGRILVATEAGFMNGKSTAEISVSDDGSGMPPEIAARATEPFFTTKELGKGTGLGLFMVSGFCQQSGGEMVIETKPGVGTKIRLIFPVPEQ